MSISPFISDRSSNVEKSYSSFLDLGDEVKLLIIRRLGICALARLGQTCKSLHSLTSDNALWSHHLAFGKAQWAELLNVDVGIEPRLPNIRKMLGAPCPIWQDKKVADTHMLVLIPKTINGDPLTLDCFGRCIKPYFPRSENGFAAVTRVVERALKNKSVIASCWVLMTKNVIADSKNLGFSEQERMVTEVSKKAQVTYEIPSVLEAVVCIITQYIASQRRLCLFGNNPWTYTLCKDNAEGYDVAAGAFSDEGLIVFHYCSFFPKEHIGVAGVRRFFADFT